MAADIPCGVLGDGGLNSGSNSKHGDIGLIYSNSLDGDNMTRIQKMVKRIKGTELRIKLARAMGVKPVKLMRTLHKQEQELAGNRELLEVLLKKQIVERKSNDEIQ